jgi:hypothetical protein
MSIAVLTPSRGRPERFNEMVDAIRRTACTEVTVYAGLDEDDADRYHLPVGVRCTIRPRMRLAPWTNLLAKQALRDGHSILAFLGDDHRPRTAGWDLSVLEAMNGMGPGLVYTRDGLQDERLPTAPFWHADVIRALGWYYPPVLKHLYADDYWLCLARDLGRCTYLPDVLIEHEHPSAGKAVEDESYRESAACFDHDRDAFAGFLTHNHPGILARVREELGL